MTIKEHIGKAKYDPHGMLIHADREHGEYKPIADVRGWAIIDGHFDSEEEAWLFMDQLGQFITDAINEKIEREKQ